MLEISLLLIEFTNIFRNEILSIQCITRNAAIRSTDWLAGLKSNIPLIRENVAFRPLCIDFHSINYSRKATRKNWVLYGPLLWKATALILLTRTERSTANYLPTLYQLKRQIVIKLCESMVAFRKIYMTVERCRGLFQGKIQALDWRLDYNHEKIWIPPLVTQLRNVITSAN
jgi:hypothetical protein